MTEAMLKAMKERQDAWEARWMRYYRCAYLATQALNIGGLLGCIAAVARWAPWWTGWVALAASWLCAFVWRAIHRHRMRGIRRHMAEWGDVLERELRQALGIAEH